MSFLKKKTFRLTNNHESNISFQLFKNLEQIPLLKQLVKMRPEIVQLNLMMIFFGA